MKTMGKTIGKAAGFFAVAAMGLLSACGSGGESDAPAQPDQTVQQLMVNEVQPTTEIYWGAVQYISDEDGDHDIFPQTDEDWERARAAAVKISEFGELLSTPEYSQGRGDDWNDFANALIEVGQRAEQTTIDRSPEDVFEVGGIVYRVCQGCHLAYPPENMP